MLYFDRIDFSELINVNDTNASKNCDICHCWVFLDKGFEFQPSVLNRCHDVLMMPINLNYIAILNICGVDYHCFINGISEVINVLQNANLSEKSGTL